MKKIFFPSIILILFLVGCQSTTSDPTPPTSTALPSTNTSQPTNTAEPQNTSIPFAGGECDPSAEQIDMDTNYTRHIQGGYYPEGCSLFCLQVPTGKYLIIGIKDFRIDCDIYVDKDLSVLGYSDRGAWQSNVYGTWDEQLTINDPEGRYYIQVCTYEIKESMESDFILYSIFIP